MKKKSSLKVVQNYLKILNCTDTFSILIRLKVIIFFCGRQKRIPPPT